MKTAHALSTGSYWMPDVSRASGSFGQAHAPAVVGTYCQTGFAAMIHLSLVASTPEMVCSGGAAAVQNLALHCRPRRYCICKLYFLATMRSTSC